MRTITNQELIDANRKAYAEHRLIAQNMDLFIYGNDPCVYVGPVLPDGKQTACAIGVALNDSEQDDILSRHANNGTSAILLLDFGIVQFEDIHFARDLQAAHDNWATSQPEVDEETSTITCPVDRYHTLIGL